MKKSGLIALAVVALTVISVGYLSTADTSTNKNSIKVVPNEQLPR